MARSPSLNSLRIFESAARLLSFKLAAKELYITPSAISNQINKLEDELGLKLFRRLNREVQLTDAGAKYYLKLHSIFEEIDEATRNILHINELPMVSIAIPPTLLQMCILPKIRTFHGKHPDINLKFFDTLRHFDLEKEEIDIAIRYGHFPDSTKDIDFILEEDLCLICTPDLIKKNNGFKQIEDLSKYRWIYTERRMFQWESYLYDAGYSHIKPNETIWFLNSIHTLSAALNGSGVALFNRYYIQSYLDNGSLVNPIDWPTTNISRKLGYYSITNTKSRLAPEVQSFINWLKNLDLPR